MKKFLLIFSGLLLLVGCEKEDAVVLDEMQQNRAPEAFDLISPTQGEKLDVYDITFEWQRASDPENDKVTYDLYLSREGSSSLRIAEDLTETSYVMDGRSLFNNSFSWYVVAKDGKEREMVVKTTERSFTTRNMQITQMHNDQSQNLFPERFSYTGVYFNDRFLIMNGYANETLGDVWSSSNYGQQWALETNMMNTGFERYAHTNVILRDKLYMIGGYSNDMPLGTIYSSMNGTDWMQESFAGTFTPRYEHTSVMFKDKMWVIGGYNDNVFMDDVISWTGNPQDRWIMEAEGNNTPFNGIRGHSSVVYDNKMWVIGGTDRNGYLNTVWTSSDGKNWTPGRTLPMMSAYHKSVVFDNKIWIIGGLTETGPSNQVYYYDMETNMWNAYEMPMEFRGLYNHAVITVDEGTPDDGIYILGSFNGSDYIRDMWKLY